MANRLSNSRFQSITAQAWVGMLAILLMMLLVDLERFAMRGQYKELSESLLNDPGVTGLEVLVCLLCINVIMQLAIRTFSTRLFRITVFGLTITYATFFLLHQVIHVIGGESLGIHTPLDFTHHLLGAWGVWSAWCWSKDA